jgi:hypothetical protein
MPGGPKNLDVGTGEGCNHPKMDGVPPSCLRAPFIPFIPVRVLILGVLWFAPVLLAAPVVPAEKIVHVDVIAKSLAFIKEKSPQL